MSELVIRPKSRWYFIDLQELWRFRELFYIFVWRDIKIRYKQTVIGVGWVLFQPLVSAAIFTVFFGNFAKIPSQDLPYPVFVLVGLIFWSFFSTALSHASTSFIENDTLVRKVYFPREILPISSVVTACVDFLVSFVVFLVVTVIYGVALNPLFIGMVLVGLFVAATASAGLGLLLASINIKYRDVRYIVPFFLQLMIFVTPVIYPLNIVRPSYQYLLALNPMTGIIDGLRTSLASGTIQHPWSVLISVISAIAVFAIGLAYFRKTEKFFADII